MLPLPGSPAWSWSRFQARIAARFEGADWRVCVAFWLFGLVNNILYVIILTAALDLVGPSIPKATVLLASIIPGLATKIVVPFFIHLIPYSMRIVLLVVLSTCGMLAVALSPATTNASSISAKLAGIILANISSGAGESNFLSLTHFYGPFSLAAWGSGTGGAGLIGAGFYAFATNELGISVRATLLGSALLPAVMLLTFFTLLPRNPLKLSARNGPDHKPLSNLDDDSDVTQETTGLLDETSAQIPLQHHDTSQHPLKRALAHIKSDLHRMRSLIIPYMAPLFLVYLAEYTINQGVAPTLLFPLEESPFDRYRAFYPTYGALYQTGVFISRSSLALFQIRALYVPSFLQVLNLAILTAHAIHPFIPSVYFVFAIVLWEGLLGGLVYVSAYALVREQVAEEDREFSLSAVTVSDSAGICVAGFLGVVMETALCNWQVEHGRDWCRRL
ncbi:protein btn1 [Neohortaea acidophila]|uniref:Protein BTN n=1 Tax=Neohortaea acidophila TaxID=245834 RepID=A0A6A6PH89_9PEZI|nr:protein btn1 [Neohortaea acidophila]KAF2479275.1 protein btn1 [Neohortaea acidophila]